MLSFRSGLPRLPSTLPVGSSSPSSSRSTSLVSLLRIGLNSEYTAKFWNGESLLTVLLAAAISTKAELHSLPGDFQSPSRLLHCFSSSPFAGSSPNHLVGLSRLGARKRPVTSSEDFVASLVRTWARPKPSSKIFATSLSLNVKPPNRSPTLPCSSVSAPASYTLAVVSSWSSGSKSCKSGSVLLV